MHHRAPGRAHAPRPAAGRRSERLARRRRKRLLALAAGLAVTSGAGLALPHVVPSAPGPRAVALSDAAQLQQVNTWQAAPGRGAPGAAATTAPAAAAPQTPSTAGTTSAAGTSAAGTSAAGTSAAGAPAAVSADPAAIDAREHRGDQRKNRPAPPAPPNPACTLAVPDAPTSAAGLATPYRLTATDRGAGACHEANPDQSAFVEAAIYDPTAHSVSIYHPVVVDGGDQPAAAPVPVSLPAGAVVGVWFGFNGDTLTLAGPGAANCVNGLPGSPFGQFAYCNAPAFFAAVNGDRQVTVPPLGTARDGQPCPTTRDFSVVDQDQSDNLATAYRVIGGRIAQDTTATSGGTKLTNGSDEGLLAKFIDPALGCAAPMAPDLTNGGAPTPSLALNELSAARNQAAPAALVPTSDPMVLVDGRTSRAKADLYRAGVNQPSLATDPGQSPGAYCSALGSVAPPRLLADASLLRVGPSPAPDFSNLLAFLVNRLQGSFQNLSCTPDAHVTGELRRLAAQTGTAGH